MTYEKLQFGAVNSECANWVNALNSVCLFGYVVSQCKLHNSIVGCIFSVADLKCEFQFCH